MAEAEEVKKRVLITGSSGMLGVDLSEELKGKFEVYGSDLVQRTAYSVQHFVGCDITNRNSVGKVTREIKPDVIIHAAAWTDVDGCELDPDRAYKVNAEGTKNVALACAELNVPLIYISTDFVFDGKKKWPYKESDKTGPLSVYGKSKLAGEEAVKKIARKFYIVRTSWLYGKNGKNFVDTIIANAKPRKELKVVRDQVGSPTYTRDLAEAIHALIGKISNHGIYHISNSGAVSWFEYAKEILKLTGSRTKVLPISSKELDRPAPRPAMSVMDNGKFIKFTSYRMRPWKAALKDYLKGS